MKIGHTGITWGIPGMLSRRIAKLPNWAIRALRLLRSRFSKSMEARRADTAVWSTVSAFQPLRRTAIRSGSTRIRRLPIWRVPSGRLTRCVRCPAARRWCCRGVRGLRTVIRRTSSPTGRCAESDRRILPRERAGGGAAPAHGDGYRDSGRHRHDPGAGGCKADRIRAGYGADRQGGQRHIGGDAHVPGPDRPCPSEGLERQLRAGRRRQGDRPQRLCELRADRKRYPADA